MDVKHGWRLSLAAVAALLVLAGAICAGPSTASTSLGGPGGPPAAISVHTAADNLGLVQRIGACLSGGGKGDFLLLLDRSGSLQTTDPGGARVDAAKYLVDQWAASAARERLDISVAIAGFDRDFEKVLDWTPISSTAPLLTTLDGLRAQNNGQETDYWNASSGARRELASRAKTGETHCSVAVWFTDGEYALTAGLPNAKKAYAANNALTSEADVASAVDAGKVDLCRPGGVADQGRSLHIMSLAVGLSSSDKPNFSFLKGMITGEPTCGRLTSPTPGAFYEVANVRDLFFTFDQFVTGKPPTIQQGGVCTGGICPSGTHPFVLDAAVGAVHVLGDSEAKDQRVWLISPTGQPIQLSRGSGPQSSTAVPGAKVSWRWEGPEQGSVSLDLNRVMDAGWVGPWGVVFTSAAGGSLTSRTSLRIYGDLVPTWDAKKTTLRSGEQPPLTVGVGRADGSVVDPRALSDTTTVEAALVLPDGSQRPIVQGAKGLDIAAPHPVDLKGLPGGPAKLRLTLNVTTRSWQSGTQTVSGTRLEPVIKDVTVEIKAPANYPEVPTEVDFGHVEAATSVARDLMVSGSGCVWLDGEAEFLTTPQGVTGSRITSPASGKESCASGKLPLTLTTSQVGNGLASGTMRVMSLPDDRTAAPVARPVNFRLDMEPPMDPCRFWLSLVGLTLVGLLIPVGLLYLMKWMTARIPGEAVAYGQVTGQIDDTTSFLDTGARLNAHELHVVPTTGGVRELVLPTGRLTTKAGLGLTEPGYVVVADGPGVSIADDTKQSKGRARLPVAVQGHWFATLDSTDPQSGPVTITFLTTTGDGDSLSRLVDDARSRVRDVVQTARTSIPGAPTSAPPPEGAGGSGDLFAPGSSSPPSKTASDPFGAFVASEAPDPFASGHGAPAPESSGPRPTQPGPAQGPTTTGFDW